MLAVQPPSMGSSKPPHLEMPFGYSFDTSTSNYPFPSPTAPAPGPSLLDDNESKFLDSFFDGVSSDQFNYDFFNNAPDGSELGLGWEELPPTFMGTTSSFGQQPQIGSHGIGDLHYGEMNTHLNPGHNIPPSASADVLAAATLLQNGSNGRSYSMADGSLMRTRDPQLQHLNDPPRAQSLSQPISRMPLGMQTRAAGDDFVRDTLGDSFYADTIFGSQSDASARHRGVGQRVDIRWGSDAAFNTSQGFMPPPGPDNVSATERYHLQTVENALIIGTAQVPSSTDTTQPSSPVVTKTPVQPQRPKSIVQNEEDDQDSRPRKRRKGKFQEDDEDDEDFQSPVSASKSSTKKRKPMKKGNESQSQDTESGHKRRKSAAAATAKAARENLTEEQKRENHIKSEQKRRTLIREGFEDLGELVPGLRGGGFSKSAVLIMAADWLEELINGNQALKATLDQMEGRS